MNIVKNNAELAGYLVEIGKKHNCKVVIKFLYQKEFTEFRMIRIQAEFSEMIIALNCYRVNVEIGNEVKFTRIWSVR